MSETPHRTLHLVVKGFPPERLGELASPSSDTTEIFELTEESAREALQKIFVADTITVWGQI